MNILITIYRGLGFGGAEVSTKLLAEKLRDFGHKVIMVSTSSYEGLDTRIFKEFRNLPFYKYHEFYLSGFLRKIIKKENIDIVYPQDRLTTIPAMIAGRRENKKVVVHFRDFWFACPRSSCLAPDNLTYDLCSYKILLKKYPKKRVLWDMWKWHYLKKNWGLLEKADAKIVNVKVTKDKLNLCGIRSNIYVSDIARDLTLFQNADGESLKREYKFKKYVVSFVGSLLHSNGIGTLVRIIPMVLRENKDITFLIVGDGNMMGDLKMMVKKNRLEESVILAGRVPLEKVAQFLDISDILLFPHIWEDSFSGVIIEGGAMGKPMIISNIGAVKDMKENFKVLVEPFDYEDWKNQILRLVKNKKLRGKLGKNAKEMVERKYTSEVIAGKIEKILMETLKSRKSIKKIKER